MSIVPFTENNAYGNMPSEVPPPPTYIPPIPTSDDIESLRRNVNRLLARVIILEGKIK